MASSSVLTPDGIRYAIERTPDRPQVEITPRRRRPARAPGRPVDRRRRAREAGPDRVRPVTDTLYVVWTRENEGGAEIRYATLNAAGQWSAPRNVAAGSADVPRPAARPDALRVRRHDRDAHARGLVEHQRQPARSGVRAVRVRERRAGLGRAWRTSKSWPTVGDGVTASDFD